MKIADKVIHLLSIIAGVFGTLFYVMFVIAITLVYVFHHASVPTWITLIVVASAMCSVFAASIIKLVLR